MKALTLFQPWATLVALGKKRIETRSWKTNYRGQLAIHASQNQKYMIGLGAVVNDPYFRGTISFIQRTAQTPPFPLGMIIATCDLIDCQPTDRYNFEAHKDDPAWGNYYHRVPKTVPSLEKSPGYIDSFEYYLWEITREEQDFGDYSPGRYLWFLENVKPLPQPVPVKGALNLWDWDEAEPDLKLDGWILRPSKLTYYGKSLCNFCNKEMAGCWDVVCSRCRYTFCYDHARDIQNSWVCFNCLGIQKEEI